MKSTTNYLFFILFCFALLSFSSCTKDNTHSINIRSYDWKLQSISINGEVSLVPKGDFKEPDAYLLKFASDSIFQLPNNTNSNTVRYNIPENGKIATASQSGTRIAEGEHAAFNSNLRSIISGVSSYTVKGRTLTFTGSNGEAEFKRR